MIPLRLLVLDRDLMIGDMRARRTGGAHVDLRPSCHQLVVYIVESDDGDLLEAGSGV